MVIIFGLSGRTTQVCNTHDFSCRFVVSYFEFLSCSIFEVRLPDDLNQRLLEKTTPLRRRCLNTSPVVGTCHVVEIYIYNTVTLEVEHGLWNAVSL